MSNLQSTLQIAEGYCDLGMWTDAGNVLEDLGFFEKKTAGVLRIKARSLAAEGKWEEGLMVAMLLRRGDAACRSIRVLRSTADAANLGNACALH